MAQKTKRVLESRLTHEDCPYRAGACRCLFELYEDGRCILSTPDKDCLSLSIKAFYADCEIKSRGSSSGGW